MNPRPRLRTPSSYADLRGRVAVELPQAVRIVVAACAGWQVCLWLGARQPPVYAAIVPLVAMRDQPYSAFNVSTGRLVGVIAGIAVGIGVVHVLGLSVLAVAVVLTIGLLAAIALRTAGTFTLQVALSALLVFSNDNPAAYGFARLWETAVGAAVTVALAPFLLPPDARRRFTARLLSVTDDLAEQLRTAADLVVADPLDERALQRLRDACRGSDDVARGLLAELVEARRAVQHNPLRRADRRPLASLEPLAALAAELARQVRVLADEVADLGARPDLQPRWPAMGAALRTVLLPLATGLRDEFGSRVQEDPPPGDALTDARRRLQEWSTADPDPVNALVRRPVRRLLAALRPES